MSTQQGFLRDLTMHFPEEEFLKNVYFHL
jgi:hypothetical protein